MLHDNDNCVLEAAYAADAQYERHKRDDHDGALRRERDRAYAALSAARLVLIDAAVSTTAEDVEEMRRLRDAVRQVAERQVVVEAVARVAGFLLRLAVV